jgi:hypothetical protein
MMDDPISESLVKPNVPPRFFALNPFVTQYFCSFVAECLVKPQSNGAFRRTLGNSVCHGSLDGVHEFHISCFTETPFIYSIWAGRSTSFFVSFDTFFGDHQPHSLQCAVGARNGRRRASGWRMRPIACSDAFMTRPKQVTAFVEKRPDFYLCPSPNVVKPMRSES